MLKSTYQFPKLPPSVDLESIEVLRALAKANRALAELKGRAAVIPNQEILIDTLTLQEAKASSHIENIVTTHDELFQADLFPGASGSANEKAVTRYRDAIRVGRLQLRANQGLLTTNLLIHLFQILKRRDDGFRTQPGTAQKNDHTGEIVYVPPQDPGVISGLMEELEFFMNEDSASQLDPLIKMALIHHQFESIHPFPDGNGRIGRILNVLYITRTGLLDIPILYLSRYIIHHKNDYYRRLQSVRDTNGSEAAWQDWVRFMLDAVADTAAMTLTLVEGIRTQMTSAKQRMRGELPKLYSQELLNNLFRHPYTKIEFVVQDVGVTRQTAAKYLDTLSDHGLLRKHKSGRVNYYVNADLVSLLMNATPDQLQ
jgi:Fic family protein